MTDTTAHRSPWMAAGDKIAALRMAREITQQELAEQAGLPSANWVADVEAGRRPVPSAFYRALALQFGMTVSDFAAFCLKQYDHQAYEALFGSDQLVLKLAA